MKPRLYTKYVQEVVPALKEKRGYTNVHQIPRIEKIVVNMGVSASAEKGSVEEAVKDMTSITGRKPVICKAKKSVANFKLREGQAIGCRVTLRRDVMYEFFDRLVTSTLPRIRDFRGISARQFDGRGSFSLGLPDQTIFPEIELEKIKRIAAREVPGAPQEVLLVLDSTVGQNGLAQAREFTNVAGVNGIVLTKLDGTAKGGVAVAIANDLKLPIRYVGIGEGIDDLVQFDAKEYVDGLFEEKW